MAATPKQFYRAAAPTTSTMLYTVPSATTAIVTSIVVANASASPGTFSILLNGVEIAGSVQVQANSMMSYDIKQVLSASEIISGFASSSNIKFHLSGVEV